MSKKGFCEIITYKRDKLPKNIHKYFSLWKNAVDHCNRVARLFEPISAVQSVKSTTEEKSYVQTLISFQNTKRTNISSVNALNSNRLFIVKRTRLKTSK